MGIFVGIDIGTVSVKIALIFDSGSKESFTAKAAALNLVRQYPRGIESNAEIASQVFVLPYHQIKGNPIAVTHRMLASLYRVVSADRISGVRVCGSGGKLLSELLDINYENEFRAIARGVGALYPHIHTVFEIGGQNSKYIRLENNAGSAHSGIVDYEKSGDCAAGTGSFLDQQASRLQFQIEEVGQVVLQTAKSAKIAGRCSVFAKSDMIHAQQKGYSPPEVLKGLCEAVARNFKSSVVKGRKVTPPVLFIGGVAANAGVAEGVRQVFKMEPDQLIIPDYYAWMAAIGTALAERDALHHSPVPDIHILKKQSGTESEKFPVSKPLSMEKVVLLRDKIRPRYFGENERNVPAYMGIDVGSVSTNVVVLDENGNMIKEIYTRTAGRPIEVVDLCLKEIEREFAHRIQIKGVGTTGSGRELIGELVGADTIKDEITAHKTGAEFLARTMLNTEPDTIFEIGGQDSKFISLQNGVVVDFAMNEACAAGTGSFLEERAEELGISIKEEFANLALSSRSPVKLGERCTVFMQQDVATFQQRGASREDLTAGLAYSIVYNYLNRVVRGRKIGEVIFFQGGTAYNNAIASAFARVLDKEIIVPPYNGVVGAVGAALLAKEKMLATRNVTKFRGFSLEKVNYHLREFTCKACSNFCHMQEFTVDGEKTYWGDQCSDKFRRKQQSEQKPVIPDLLKLRRELLFAEYEPDVQGKATIGLPRALYVYEQFPFWNTFFRHLGYRVVLSEETNHRLIRSGTEISVAEPCLPIQAYHGHVKELVDKQVDWIFIPNTINAETPFKEVNSYYCPWGQTIPFVIKNSEVFASISEKILSPSLRFRDGKNAIAHVLMKTFRSLGENKKNILRAVDAAYLAQNAFQHTLQKAGERALRMLRESGKIGIVLVGRPYNIHDRGMTLDIGNKLRDYYGINVIPMDFLPLDSVDISDVNMNMYWNYGRKIIAAAKIVSQFERLHIIYLTNFKCGPDSYIKHYITRASGKPFLTLQFDGHGNDAGYITRCEAYLDSKGALRVWTSGSDEAIRPKKIKSVVTV